MTSMSKLCVLATTLTLLTFSPLTAAPKKGGTKLVPFKGKWTGTAVQTTTTEPLPEGGEVTTTETTLEGKGNGTHLGRYTMEASSVTSSDPTADTSDLVFIAANGDEVYATFTGESVTGSDGLVDSELQAIIVGGTGRFATSTGYFTFKLTTDPETGKSAGSYNGKISSPGKGN
ncbi:hypothetical protein Pan44_16150 [Caulifigura coniformis]|uniref:DUF1579 domain-containing protein n=1 Tax=Caulifigura coniformis TaxID=2527983 RepID=A0A517SBU8_9PLAN|nr:hypothetical protein [Caulifigura coniformis]QDT53593.1 hypothetical protein Pan44_16150 [Caulifigura coniformis]